MATSNPLFPNNPGYNLYKGARYVPKFTDKPDGQWDNTIAYEPLTIVLYQGNSYTSRWFVPVGANINDTTYWLPTGNFNGQLITLQTQINQLKNTLMFVSVKDYGAVGNGVNDDTQSIQTALTSGKNLIFPAGNYIVTSKITATNNTILIGDNAIISFNIPKTTDLTPKTGALTLNNCALINISFRGSGTYDENQLPLICINDSNYASLINCDFEQCDFYTAISAYQCSNVQVHSCSFNSYGFCGVMLVECSDCTISNSFFSNPQLLISGAQYAIVLSPLFSPFKASKRITVSNCQFISNGTDSWECIDAHGGEGYVISNNTISNFFEGVAFVKHGNGFVKNSVISNNVIISRSYSCILETDNVIISGNNMTCNGTTSSGVISSLGDKTLINGNTINSTGRAFYISGGGCSILNNLVTSNEGIVLSGPTSNIELIGNMLTCTSEPYYLNSILTTRFVMSGNQYGGTKAGTTINRGAVPDFTSIAPTHNNAEVLDFIKNSGYTGAADSPIGWIYTGTNWKAVNA